MQILGLSILFAQFSNAAPLKNWPFITMNKGLLFEGEKQFRFASFNVPNLFYIEDRHYFATTGNICKERVPEESQMIKNGYHYGIENDIECAIGNYNDGSLGPWAGEFRKYELPHPYEQEDALLTIAGVEGRVARTYTLGFGHNYHVKGVNSFNEDAFIAMDHALDLARKHRVRLIIPFINNHNGGDEQGYGNFGDYISLCQMRDLHPSEFYTNKILIEDLKNIIDYVLNRNNTINGILYKDDPTVLAWSTGNELGGWEGEAPPLEWTLEIAKHIKSIATRTLVYDGTMGGLDIPTRFPEEVLKSDLVDIFSAHYYYGDSDIGRINRDSQFIGGYKKAFVIGEIGFELNIVKTILELAIAEKFVSGALVWSLRTHSQDGGFYVHKEQGDYFAYHAPGFVSLTESGFGVDDIGMMSMVRDYAFAIQGLDAKLYLHPIPPKATAVSAVLTPHDLRWRGSAWASSYRLFRREDGLDWVFIADVSDGVQAGTTFFKDNSALVDVIYFYKISPVSVDSVENRQHELVIGPLALEKNDALIDCSK
jgi:hypothetical protein